MLCCLCLPAAHLRQTSDDFLNPITPTISLPVSRGRATDPIPDSDKRPIYVVLRRFGCATLNI